MSLKILSLSLEKLLKGECLLSPVQAASNIFFLELITSVKLKLEKYFVFYFCHEFKTSGDPKTLPPSPWTPYGPLYGPVHRPPLRVPMKTIIKMTVRDLTCRLFCFVFCYCCLLYCDDERRTCIHLCRKRSITWLTCVFATGLQLPLPFCSA